VPGSHHAEQNARLAGSSKRQARTGDAGFSASQESFPGNVAATSTGDVIAFGLHTWHASSGGRDRLAWNAVYLRCPETADDRDRTQRHAHDAFESVVKEAGEPVRRTGVRADVRLVSGCCGAVHLSSRRHRPQCAFPCLVSVGRRIVLTWT
jgi:hypothetical protein